MTDHSSYDDNPYVGPQSFTELDKDKFFGRDDEAEELLSLVISRRSVLFYAQSGAGKTSLINARLIPKLKVQGFEVLPIGRVSSAESSLDRSRQNENQPKTETNIFIESLMSSLDERGQTSDKISHLSLAQFLDFLVFSAEDDTFYINEEYVYAAGEEIKPRALIIDQFEEILTAYPEVAWKQRIEFFRQLGEAIRGDSLLWVILTLREDYVGALDPFAHLIPGRLRNRYYMQRMRQEAAIKAIRKPVEIYDWVFQEEAAKELVENLLQIQGSQIRPGRNGKPPLGEFIEPVQLQVVCYQLWEDLNKRKSEKRIKISDLREQARKAGGESIADIVDTALTQYYEKAIAEIVEDESRHTENDLRYWFENELITPNKTRNFIPTNEGKVGTLEQDVVEKLDLEYHLVRGEKRAGDTKWYELTHDRFIEPILNANQVWWVQQNNPVYQAAREWDQTNRPKSHLYVGQQLKLALETVNLETTEDVVKDFLRESKRAKRVSEQEVKITRNLRQFESCFVMSLGAALLYFLPFFVCSISILISTVIPGIWNDPNALNSSNNLDDLFIGLLLIVILVLGPGIVGAMVGKSGLDIFRYWFQSSKTLNAHLQIFNEKLAREEFEWKE